MPKWKALRQVLTLFFDLTAMLGTAIALWVLAFHAFVIVGFATRDGIIVVSVTLFIVAMAAIATYGVIRSIREILRKFRSKRMSES